MIAAQAGNGRGQLIFCQHVDHLGGVRPTVNVITQQNDARMFRRSMFEILRNATGHLLQEIEAAVNIADAIEA